MHAPADSMIASTPYAISSPRDHATIGYVPWSLRRAVAGGALPRHMSSMPPVPNVTFVAPLSTQPWPTIDAC